MTTSRWELIVHAAECLGSYLGPVAARRKSDGRLLASDPSELAGAYPEGWSHG